MKFLTNTSLIEKAIIMLVIIMFFVQIKKYNRKIEPFTGQVEKYKIYENDALFDKFYTEIYDQLLYNPKKNIFEVATISVEVFNDKNNNKLLDIGCGLGHHVEMFYVKGFDCIGLDKSKAMIDRAKKMYPKKKFMVGDANQTLLLPSNSYNVITILYFTVYYFKNKMQLFNNCHNWLDYKGHLAVHLVNKDKFDPIVPSGNPIKNISIQDYTNKRITKSIIHFDKFKYTSNFELKNNVIGEFKESFKFTNNNIRENRHILYFETIDKIIRQIETVGFKMIKKINMKNCDYDDQYLIIFQKLR